MDHQVYLSTSRQLLCLSCMTSGGFFSSPIDWNNFFCRTLIIVHFFVLKHENQTLSYIHTKFEGDKNFFFLQFILWEHPFFCLNTENYLGLSGWCPWNYLVWIGLTSAVVEQSSWWALWNRSEPVTLLCLSCKWTLWNRLVSLSLSRDFVMQANN